MYKAIFSDLDGVILNNGFRTGVVEYEKIFNIPAGEFYKIIHDHDAWKQFTLGLISQNEYLNACKERCHNYEYEFDEHKYIELVYKNTIPNLEIIELLKKLSTKSIIGVVSNCPREWYEHFFELCQMKDFVTVSAISGYEHMRKPSTELFQVALRKANTSADQSIYIDDRADRIEGATNLGIEVYVFDGDINGLKNKINN